MNEEQFNIFCGALPHSTYVIQWSGSHVWKIGGKVFSIAGWNKGGPDRNYLQGLRHRLRVFTRASRIKSRALSRVVWREMDPGLRLTWIVGGGSERAPSRILQAGFL